MANIILASHGELAKGMLYSAHMIVGDLAEKVRTYCLYPGQNPEDYAKTLKEEIKSSKEEYILVADIMGGSVHTALSQLTIYNNVTILSGMNLNLVLSLLLGDQSDVTDNRLHAIITEAQNGITITRSLEVQEDEDF